MNNISKELEVEAKTSTIYPEINKVFRAFIPLDKIKVVILGQDPYHNGSAVGLCFSVLPGNKVNPSLKNIYTELKNEGYSPVENGILTHWAKNCCMLNTALTVRKGEADSHTHIWFDFSEKVIKYISDNTKNTVWLLMGSKALEFNPLIDEEKHTVFVTSHPSPFSAHRGFRYYPSFLGSNVFTQINDYLQAYHNMTIKW